MAASPCATVFADELGQEARLSGISYNDVRAEIQRRVTANHPIYLGIVEAVVYSEKTDRYTVKYGKSSAKITDEAATYLMQHGKLNATSGPRPTVYANMSEGFVDSVLLMFTYRGEL